MERKYLFLIFFIFISLLFLVYKILVKIIITIMERKYLFLIFFIFSGLLFLGYKIYQNENIDARSNNIINSLDLNTKNDLFNIFISKKEDRPSTVLTIHKKGLKYNDIIKLINDIYNLPKEKIIVFDGNKNIDIGNDLKDTHLLFININDVLNNKEFFEGLIDDTLSMNYYNNAYSTSNLGGTKENKNRLYSPNLIIFIMVYDIQKGAIDEFSDRFMHRISNVITIN
jgi:hypothetical protein